MTAAQLALALSPLHEPDCSPDATIQERWEQWRDANPWVMAELERLVDDWITAGFKRVGIKQMWEVIRYRYGVTTGDRFKCNNDFTSRAARDLIARRPEWAEYIETRELRAA